MRKKIYASKNHAKTETSKNHANFTEGEKNMETSKEYANLTDMLEVYEKMYNRHPLMQDSCQNVMEKIVANDFSIRYNKRYEYFKAAMNNDYRNRNRNEYQFDLLKQGNLELNVDNLEYGIPNQYVSELIEKICNLLDSKEMEIFKLYHIEGYTLKEIAAKSNSYDVAVLRIVKKINTKIFSLNSAYFVERRYETAQCHKKRDKVKYPDMKPSEPSEAIQIEIDSYIPQERISRLVDVNALTHKQLTCIKKRFEVKSQVGSQSMVDKGHTYYVDNVQEYHGALDKY